MSEGRNNVFCRTCSRCAHNPVAEDEAIWELCQYNENLVIENSDLCEECLSEILDLERIPNIESLLVWSWEPTTEDSYGIAV